MDITLSSPASSFSIMLGDAPVVVQMPGSEAAEQAALDATAAAASASAAAGSATSASGSASAASASATAAAGSATSASGSATSASASATAAAGSATSTSGSASAASASATAAAGSATSASGSATSASGSATAAAGSATSAGTAASNAEAERLRAWAAGRVSAEPYALAIDSSTLAAEYPLAFKVVGAKEVVAISAAVRAGTSFTFNLLVDGVPVYGPTTVAFGTDLAAAPALANIADGSEVTVLFDSLTAMTSGWVQVDLGSAEAYAIPEVEGDWEINAAFTGDGDDLAGFAPDGSARKITVTGNATLSDGVLNVLGAAESWIRQDADRTLTSTTASQKLFAPTGKTNGRLTLPTGVYTFAASLITIGMDAASGNMSFDILGAGGAVLAGQAFQVFGLDNSSTTSAANATTTGRVNNNATPASAVLAGTGTQCRLFVVGSFTITTAGTIIPSTSLVTAAAATLCAGSFIALSKVAELGTNGSTDAD